MSRIGKQIITIPAGVTVEVKDSEVMVKGPKGELKRILPREVSVVIDGDTVTADVQKKEDKKERSLWGTFSAHIKNMVTGVTVGFKRQLEVNGVGYRVAMQGKDLKLEVGFSHSVVFDVPENVTATVEKNVITLESLDIELLGATAAEIRRIRKPEPYKGKGIKYMEEVIRRKAGKTSKS